MRPLRDRSQFSQARAYRPGVRPAAGIADFELGCFMKPETA